MWEIHPIHTATQHCVIRGMIDYGKDEDKEKRMDIPFICWLLRNVEDGSIYLVDCGPDYDNETNARLHQPMTMQRDWHILNRLNDLKISINDIVAIIATHLHWDHLKAIVDFPASMPVYAQKKELDWAISSKGKTIGKAYEAEQEKPFFAQCQKQYRFLTGEEEIAPGINVMPIPGHTMGSQAILIDSVKGKIILANDLVNVLENWSLGIPPGNIANQQAYAESMNTLRKLESEGWKVMPGHDFRIFSDLKNHFNSELSLCR